MSVGWVDIWVSYFIFQWVQVVCWVCYWILIAIGCVYLNDRCFVSTIIFDALATRISFYSLPFPNTSFELYIHTAFLL
jgi:hypothetical protein